MIDIYTSMPWQCDDKDCPHEWHEKTFWMHDDESKYTVDMCSDGYHEDIDEEDLPTCDEVIAAWIEYSRYCLETGTDPLRQFYIKHERKVEERWEFKLAPAIGGPILIQARRAGKVYSGDELPAHVKEYLSLGHNHHLTYFQSWEDLVEAVPGVKAHVWHVEHIDSTVYRNPELIARDIRRAARRHLRRKGA